jgi:curved DNA-binding protein CbpA
MTAQNNLEIKGNLQTNSLAELFVETAAASLTGSFRLTNETHKIVIYLNNGKPVFAVSNARQHRLFELLLQNNQITKNQLADIPNFTNDLELSEALKTRGLFSKDNLDAVFLHQIGEIIKTALCWKQGEWIFSPLMRVKESIHFKINLQKLLLEHARNLPKEFVVKRFKTFNESFGARPVAEDLNIELLPQEAFVLSRFEKSFLKIEEVKQLSGLSDVLTLQTLYTLWLGGFLFRENWNPAFSEKKIFEITSARLAVKKAEEPVPEGEEPVTKPAPKTETTIAPEPIETPQAVEAPKEITLDEYLKRVENSFSYYELFDIPADADSAEIKAAYFRVAKQFHPDRFHQEKDVELLQRIQNAFSRAAHAYETLKDEDKRKTYDFKLRKEQPLQKKKDVSRQSLSSIKDQQVEMAKEAFDEGYELLMNDEYSEALPFLARAVQLVPGNARYHAFYGKVLSSDESQRYKANAEMQTAIQIEPENATFRIIMAEFYIQFELFKRAEGELQRLLAIHPDNKEARVLLDSLPKK